MRKLCFLAVLLLYYSLCTYSQFEYGSPSELKERLGKARLDADRAQLYAGLSNEYVFSHPDSSLQYAQQGLQLARDINSNKGIVYNTIGMAQSFVVLGNYPNAIELSLNTLPLSEKEKDTFAIIYSNFILSWAQREAGEARGALPYAKAATHYAEAYRDSGLLLIGLTHLLEEYEQLNQLDSALFYGKKTLEFQGNKFLEGWVGFYRSMARVYFKKKQYELALHYYRITIEPSVRAGVLLDVLDAYAGMAQVYQQMRSIDSSSLYAYKGLHEYLDVPRLDARFKAASILAENYQQDKKADSALKYIKLSAAFKDSLFSQQKARAIQSIFFNQQFRRQELKQQQAQYKNKVRFYIMIAGLAISLFIAGMLYRNSQQRKKANKLLQKQKTRTEQALQELKTAQSQLIQSEKMASLGELTAGIAHEIQNPLNFVNNFSEVSNELIEELKVKNENLKIEDAEVKGLLNDIRQNLEKINHHGKRADAIVKGMLQHSRASSGQKEPTDINALCDEYLRLAYQGFRARDKSFKATFSTRFDNGIVHVNIVPQEIGRVILNLINNAFYAVNERAKEGVPGYEPTVTVGTRRLQDRIEISVKDNGNGVPGSLKEKIFQPFFTTKPTGQGTGLGLSLAYDIVKAHGGEIKVQSKEGEGSQFVIELPI